MSHFSEVGSSQNVPFNLLLSHTIFRDEIQQLARENELLEADLTQIKTELLAEKKNKRKLEKVLADCAAALKVALTVSNRRMPSLVIRISRADTTLLSDTIT